MSKTQMIERAGTAILNGEVPKVPIQPRDISRYGKDSIGADLALRLQACAGSSDLDAFIAQFAGWKPAEVEKYLSTHA